MTQPINTAPRRSAADKPRKEKRNKVKFFLMEVLGLSEEAAEDDLAFLDEIISYDDMNQFVFLLS